MSEVRCVRIQLKPGSEPLIRDWAKKLHEERREEAIATLVDEGVTIESYFLDPRPEGDFLIGYMRATSLDQAAQIAARSDHDIDRYHQQVRVSSWAEVTRLERLVDLAVGLE